MVRATKNRKSKVSASPANIPLPSTPVIAIGPLDTPAAPKKPKAILKYLKPTVYKPGDNAAEPIAPEEILNALSRAGVRRRAAKKVAPEQVFPAPRKLFLTIVDGKTDAVIHKYVPTRLLMQISAHAAQTRAQALGGEVQDLRAIRHTHDARGPRSHHPAPQHPRVAILTARKPPHL